MSDGLKRKTLHGLFWSFIDRVGQQGIQFVISIMLARLLLPAEFGLVGMLTIFLMIGQTFINSGFGAALIQKKDATHAEECSIFYFNILVGFLAAGVLCVAAPWIAAFYGQQLLVPLTRVLSLHMVISGFAVVHAALLTRHVDFKTQTKVSITATALSGTIGVIMALNGFGIWSLVAQSLSSTLARTILLWFFNPWRPSLVFSLQALREMFGFGSRLLASGLLNTFFENIYHVVIGKLFPPAALGFYARAKGVQQLPVATFSNIINRVTFPVFSTVQDDPVRMKRGMQKAVIIIAFVTFPMMIGLALVARPLVLVLLTEKWEPCIPYLQLLCAGGFLFPLHVINLDILMAKGRSDLFFRLEVLKKILVVIAIACTYRFGISAMIYGQIMVSVFAYYLNSYYTGKLINYPLKEQVLDFAPYLGLSAIMGLGVISVQGLSLSSDLILLVCQVVTGVFLYAGLNWVCKTYAFFEVLTILQAERNLRSTDARQGA